MTKVKMKQVVPNFSSEAEEAVWWDAHRSEIEAEIRQGVKQKRPPTLGSLAERVAAEINERAARTTQEDRAQADSETKKIAAQVQCRIP